MKNHDEMKKYEVIYSIPEILRLNGFDFIKTAFFAFNGKPPENELIHKYKNRMTHGMSKNRIIYELYKNKKTNNSVKYKNITPLLISQKIRSTPILGKFLIFINNYFLGGFRRKQLRIMESMLFFQSSFIQSNRALAQFNNETIQYDKETTQNNRDVISAAVNRRTYAAFSYLKAMKEGKI